jgi:hypothetical protein
MPPSEDMAKSLDDLHNERKLLMDRLILELAVSQRYIADEAELPLRRLR